MMVQDAAGFFRSFFFDEEQYLVNKTNALNVDASQGKYWTVEDTATALSEAGMTAWEHFTTYGAFEQAADGGMGINPSSLFDVDTYYSDKLKQCEYTGHTYTKDQLVDIFHNAGMDPLTHYALYGYAEGITSETESDAVYGHGSQVELFRDIYFNEEQYLVNKTEALNAGEDQDKVWTVKETATAISEAGMTAWEHFTAYGAFEQAADGGMGIDPGENFDLNRYYEDKIDQCKEDGGRDYTEGGILAAFREAGLDPITHYALYGYLEGIAPVMESLPTIDGSSLDDVPLSGNALIDSLLFTGWNDLDLDIPIKDWNKVGAEQGNVLYYTFPTDPSVQNLYIGTVTPNFAVLNSKQQQGYEQALESITDVTGITFEYTPNAAKANLYFYTARDTSPNEGGGVTLGWTLFSDLKEDKAAVILSSPSVWPDNADPSFGHDAFMTVVHELGHALGLKHPFDAVDWTHTDNLAMLPEVLDNEAWTTMSYTNPQYTTEPWFEEGASYYSPFDLLALNYLYGTDGLNGSEGIVYDQPMQLV